MGCCSVVLVIVERNMWTECYNRIEIHQDLFFFQALLKCVLNTQMENSSKRSRLKQLVWSRLTVPRALYPIIFGSPAAHDGRLSVKRKYLLLSLRFVTFPWSILLSSPGGGAQRWISLMRPLNFIWKRNIAHHSRITNNLIMPLGTIDRFSVQVSIWPHSFLLFSMRWTNQVKMPKGYFYYWIGRRI